MSRLLTLPSPSPPSFLLAEPSGPIKSRVFGSTADDSVRQNWTLMCPTGQYITDVFGLSGSIINR